MATFSEISKNYSGKIKRALSESSLAKSAEYLVESERQTRRQRKVATVLKEINEDLKNYTIDSKPLTEEQKSQILKGAGEFLGLKKPESLVLMLKEASNDNFVALANYWATFFAEMKL